MGADRISLLETRRDILLVEFHPFWGVFDDEDESAGLRVGYPYFHTREPMKFEADEQSRSYADASIPLTTPEYEWQHSLGDIVSSLISAGLGNEFLHEFPYSDYQQLPMMHQSEDGWWRLKEHGESVPLLFPLKATK